MSEKYPDNYWANFIEHVLDGDTYFRVGEYVKLQNHLLGDAETIASLHRQLAEARARTIEECAKVLCKLCRDGVELVPHGDSHYGGWHQLTELGGAGDGGTDYEECAAFSIRALSPPQSGKGEK